MLQSKDAFRECGKQVSVTGRGRGQPGCYCVCPDIGDAHLHIIGLWIRQVLDVGRALRVAREACPWPSSAAVCMSVNERQSFTCVTLAPSSPTRFVASFFEWKE